MEFKRDVSHSQTPTLILLLWKVAMNEQISTSLSHALFTIKMKTSQTTQTSKKSSVAGLPVREIMMSNKAFSDLRQFENRSSVFPMGHQCLLTVLYTYMTGSLGNLWNDRCGCLTLLLLQLMAPQYEQLRLHLNGFIFPWQSWKKDKWGHLKIIKILWVTMHHFHGIQCTCIALLCRKEVPWHS